MEIPSAGDTGVLTSHDHSVIIPDLQPLPDTANGYDKQSAGCHLNAA
jgi:hypothetical protein